MNRAFPITRFIGRVFLFLLRCAAIILSFALLATPFNRKGFQEISDGLYSPDAPLMGSQLLDYLLHPWLSIFIGMFILIYVYVRARFISPERRWLGDLSYLVAISALMMSIQFAIYFPVIKSNAF